jgi:hypothetical protein
MEDEKEKKEIIEDDIRDRHQLMLRIVSLERNVLLAKRKYRQLLAEQQRSNSLVG